jgi:hypothetical protein
MLQTYDGGIAATLIAVHENVIAAKFPIFNFQLPIEMRHRSEATLI